MNISTRNSNNKEGEISIREIFEFLVQRWHWFLLSIMACGGIAWCYLETQQPVYKRTATLQIDEDKKNYGENVFIVNTGYSNDKKQNKVHILTSNELMLKVVEKLHLDVSYSELKRFRMQDIYKESPITVSFLDEYVQSVDLQVTPTSTKSCLLSIGEHKRNINYNDTITTPAGRLVVIPTSLSTPESYGKAIYVSRISPDLATIKHQKGITAITMDESSLYVMQYACTSIQKADDILFALTEAYNYYNELDKHREAKNTNDFLSDRIAQIGEELETLSNELTGIQLQKNIVSFESIGSQQTTETAKIREESVLLETSLSLAHYIQSYVTNAATRNELIPNVGGISEMGIDAQIQSYNSSLIQRNHLIENSGENNSIVVGIDKSLVSTRTAIAKTIHAYIEGLEIRLEQVRKQEIGILNSLTATPDVYNSYRQKKIKEALYSLLLQKQEENALKISDTDPVAKMIERPYSTTKPTPDYLKFLAMAFILGFTLPVIIWWIMVALDSKVRNRRDIEGATNLPIIGEIPTYKLKKKQAGSAQQPIMSLKNSGTIGESFYILSTHLIAALKTANVIVVTSSISGEGKSFVAHHLSATVNKMGKRAILVNMDIRKSIMQKEKSTIKEEPGVSDILSGKRTDIKPLIIHHEDVEQPDMLPAGILSQSHNLIGQLMSDRLEKMIEDLKQEYDIIILDSAPTMGLADSFIIGRVSDLTIYVVREQVLDRRILPEVEKLSQEEKLRNVHIVLNDCHYSKRNYKGYYDYSKYYGYTYSCGNRYSKNQ